MPKFVYSRLYVYIDALKIYFVPSYEICSYVLCMFLQELANLPTVEVIENDGSPSASKLFMLWNPPLCLKTVRFA